MYKSIRPVEISVELHLNHVFSEMRKATLKQEEVFRVCIWNNGDEKSLKIALENPGNIENYMDAHGITASPYQVAGISIAKENIEEDCILISEFSEAIYFYSAQETYGAFSNFSNHGFEYDGVYYKTVEHYYQSEKFDDLSYKKRIIRAETPKEAADLGKSKAGHLKSDWELLKIQVMSFAIKKKLDAHPEIRALLSATNDLLIIENSPYDNYWGIGRNGTGRNQLGTILMRARSRFNKGSNNIIHP